MGLRSSSLARKNDGQLTWVLHKKNLPQRESHQKPRETENENFIIRKSYAASSSASSEYRGRRHSNHVQRKRKNHVHSNISLDYGESVDQIYGYGITDLDEFLAKASIGRPGNIPMVLCTGCLLYQTQLDDHYQTEVALPLGTVVNAVFKNEQWLYVQTPHAEEGYIPYGSCLPLGIAPPPPDEASAPCWETQSDVFPRPVGDSRRHRHHHHHHHHRHLHRPRSRHRQSDHHADTLQHHRGHWPSDTRSSVDGYCYSGDDVVATLLYRRRGHCESDASPSRPSTVAAIDGDDDCNRPRWLCVGGGGGGGDGRGQNGVVAHRSITGYGFL